MLQKIVTMGLVAVGLSTVACGDKHQHTQGQADNLAEISGMEGEADPDFGLARPKPKPPARPLPRPRPRQPQAPVKATSPKVERGIVYRTQGARRALLDIYRPAGNGPFPVVIAIHGGGWRKGGRDQYGPVVAPMTKQGFVVVAIDYVLSASGRSTWPDVLGDAQAAVRWVRLNAARYNMDATRIAAIGESAGGHLSALLGTYPDNPDPVSSRVNAVVDFFGPSELISCAAESRQGAGLAISQMIGGTAGDMTAYYNDASPLYHVSPRSAPMLMIHGTADQLIPPSQSDKLAAALTNQGVLNRLIKVPRGEHVYVGAGFNYGNQVFMSEIVRFLNQAFAKQHP